MCVVSCRVEQLLSLSLGLWISTALFTVLPASVPRMSALVIMAYRGCAVMQTHA